MSEAPEVQNIDQTTPDPFCGPGDSYLASEKLKRFQVRYPRWNIIENRIDHCRIWSRGALEPRCLLIVGQSGVGKSSLINRYVSTHPPRDTPTGREVPVLAIETPVPASIKGLVTVLLAALGDPMAHRGTVYSMTERLVRLMRECKVELVFLDEFQHFVDRDKEKVVRSVSDWLKNLITKSGVPIVLVGMPESMQVLKDNEQLARRFSSQVQLAPFKWRGDEKAEFKKFLELVCLNMPFDEKPQLATDDIALRFFWASGGRVGPVMDIIRRAAEESIIQNWKTVEYSQLKSAYDKEIASTYPGEANPFFGDPPKIDSDGRPIRPVMELQAKEDLKAQQRAALDRGRGRKVGAPPV